MSRLLAKSSIWIQGRNILLFCSTPEYGQFFFYRKRGQAGDRKFGLFLPGNIESWGCLSPFYSFMLLRGSPALLVFFNDGPSNKRRRYLVSSTDSTVAIFLELCCIHWNTFHNSEKWVIFLESFCDSGNKWLLSWGFIFLHSGTFFLHKCNKKHPYCLMTNFMAYTQGEKMALLTQFLLSQKKG